MAAFDAAGGSPRSSKQETPELEAWFGRLEPALKEFGPFLQDKNSSWWKSDKEFAMLAFDDLSDELKNDKDILLSIATAKAAKEAANEAAKEKAAKEKKERKMKIATKLGVAVDKIVSKSLFCFGSFVLHFLPGGFVLLTFLS